MTKRLLYRDTREGLHASPGEAPKEVAKPDTVSVTDAAWKEIRRQKEKLEEPLPQAIRIGLRGGGCSGYTYTFEWDHNKARDTDLVIKNEDLVVYIDHRSLKLLKGTTLDYHRTMMSQGFKFHNPNSTGTCGCGESTSF
jgi:iron-sulfur cluster assembly protein